MLQLYILILNNLTFADMLDYNFHLFYLSQIMRLYSRTVRGLGVSKIRKIPNLTVTPLQTKETIYNKKLLGIMRWAA